MVDAERMLTLLNYRPESSSRGLIDFEFKYKTRIVDGPNAIPLTHCKGKVIYSNVDFWYNECCPFTVDVGSRTAIVRESESGKSTRLAFFGAMMSTVAQSSSMVVTSITLLLALCAATLVSYHTTLRYSMHQTGSTFSIRNLRRHFMKLKRRVKHPAFTNAF